MSDCEHCLGTGKEVLKCKYSDTDFAEKLCNQCRAGLCGSRGGSCGYTIAGSHYCNECYLDLVAEVGNGVYIEEPSY